MWLPEAEGANRGALQGVRVLDLSRILAGPTCTQILGDLGADVVKVEQAEKGDDTRRWGPPYVHDDDGHATSESAYYLAANRNKRSVALDLSLEADRAVLEDLVESADVLVENFKHGSLDKFGLGFAQVHERHPDLVYCSISGFGRTGPHRERLGYDFVAQAIGGIMSITGEPDRTPMKVGVGIADVTAGLYSTIGILAALRHRDSGGRGQLVDISLVDAQISMLVNEATNYFVSGQNPSRRGNEHPNIVPYGVYPSADGHLVIAVGNDEQFRRWCDVVDGHDLASDERFATNEGRVVHRNEFNASAKELMARRPTKEWLEELESAGVPCGSVNGIEDVFADKQVLARGMRVEMPYAGSERDAVSLVGSPLHLSATPVSYRLPPPRLGEHNASLTSLRQEGAEQI